MVGGFHPVMAPSTPRAMGYKHSLTRISKRAFPPHITLEWGVEFSFKEFWPLDDTMAGEEVSRAIWKYPLSNRARGKNHCWLPFHYHKMPPAGHAGIAPNPSRAGAGGRRNANLTVRKWSSSPIWLLSISVYLDQPFHLSFPSLKWVINLAPSLSQDSYQIRLLKTCKMQFNWIALLFYSLIFTLQMTEKSWNWSPYVRS